ncbi:MAG: AbrB family transcriptional regulator [Candidatus Dormibacteraeota bacterium]|uniref:AbrB family transcriptional regulator n=2 Tax=Candidatus Dormibacteria TaxID=3126996 RepID=A0A934K442_9BACT|nr:AbrB family transcriptional regulator [Candidatus Dormibacteraeota bacterium]MBJ7601978.1 AbrB family transcriptional regulator [Candidatus Dormibacteraeota bacterium]
MNLGVAIVIGLAAAALGQRTRVPGGAIVAPILAVAAWRLTVNQRVDVFPGWLQLLVYALLGTGIGLSIDRSSLLALRVDWPVLLLMAASVYVVAVACVLLIARVFQIDAASALLAGSPGGFTGIAGLSLSSGANVAQVVAVHTTRLLLIYATLPFILAAVNARPD